MIFLAQTRKSFGWLICSTCPPRTLHHGNLNSQHDIKVPDLIPRSCTSEGTIASLSTMDRDTPLLAQDSCSAPETAQLEAVGLSLEKGFGVGSPSTGVTRSSSW